jgi:hypothetical protein
MINTTEYIANYTRCFKAIVRSYDHPAQIYRLWPWTFPRGCNHDLDLDLERKGSIEVETMDLLRSCPAWVNPFPEPYPFRPAMLAFRERWSHKVVTIGPPEGIDFSAGYIGCKTTCVWPVLGPPQFVREIEEVVEAKDVFPESLPWCERPERRVNSMFLCQHEIRGD